jgi:hypothetical protein
VHELEPGVEQSPRDDTLADRGQHLPDGAVERPDGQRRDRQQRRPVQYLAQGLGHLQVGHRLRGGQVERPRQIAVDEEPQGADLVLPGLPGGRMTSKDLSGAIQEALDNRYRRGDWVLGMAGSSPYLNHDLIDRLRLDPAEVRRVAAEAVATVPNVARVYTRDQLIRGDVPNDLLGRRVLSGFHALRSGDLEILLDPYWIRSGSGTTHGTPYVYDAHIPLILMGPRVRPGEYGQHVALNDLAPTLATLVGVATPSGSSGRVLTEALESPAPRPPHLTH